MKSTVNFSTNLKALRKLHNLTQDDLAKIINASRSCISNYESGSRQPDSETLSLIADFFDVSVDFLLGRSPVKAVLHDDSLLAQLCDCAKTLCNETVLDISNSPAKIKCATVEFYSYLLTKENTKKKSSYTINN